MDEINFNYIARLRIKIMGIKNGAPEIISNIRRGLYNKRAKVYKIIVDGELMRYKGMIENNLTKHNAEEAIAATSFDYMKNMIDEIEVHCGYKAKEIIVYMDGSRVFNKESNRSDFRFDASLIRTVFKSICYEYGYTVRELAHGESELQMYLQRDKDVHLNVFLTNDSDMISICYGHVPKIQYPELVNNDDVNSKQDCNINWHESKPGLIKNYVNKISKPPLNIIEAQAMPDTTLTKSTYSIIDYNCTYKGEYGCGDEVQVFDSCLWINCGKSITAIGFDFIDSRIKYNKLVFRIFMALCGTDFTNNLFTDSMISGILLANEKDIEFVNGLSDIHEIIAILLLLGIRSGGTLKRFDEKAKLSTFDENEIEDSISMYLQYIDSGEMKNAIIPRPCMPLACRHYIYAMKGAQDACFVKSALQNWAYKITLSEVIENLKQHLGTFNHSEVSQKKTLKSSAKRLAASAPCEIAAKYQRILENTENLTVQLDCNITPTQLDCSISETLQFLAPVTKTVFDEL